RGAVAVDQARATLRRPALDPMAAFGPAGRAALPRERAVIFVTVGTQLPFDRLVKAVDAWAGSSGEAGAFAQIGSNAYQPAHMEWAPYLPVEMFRRKLEAASLVISH